MRFKLTREKLELGATFIFTKVNDVYIQEAKLIGTPHATLSAQGYSVALSGDGTTLFTGAPGESNLLGAIFIFQKKDSTWTQLQKLTPSNLFPFTIIQGIGSLIAVDQSGSNIIASTNGNRTVIVFSNEGSNGLWTPTAKLFPGNITSQNNEDFGNSNDDYFGASIRISANGNAVAVGAPKYGNLTNTGAVFVFADESGTWNQVSSALFDPRHSDNIGKYMTMDAGGLTIVSSGLKASIQTFQGNFTPSVISPTQSPVSSNSVNIVADLRFMVLFSFVFFFF